MHAGIYIHVNFGVCIIGYSSKISVGAHLHIAVLAEFLFSVHWLPFLVLNQQRRVGEPTTFVLMYYWGGTETAMDIVSITPCCLCGNWKSQSKFLQHHCVHAWQTYQWTLVLTLGGGQIKHLWLYCGLMYTFNYTVCGSNNCTKSGCWHCTGVAWHHELYCMWWH